MKGSTTWRAWTIKINDRLIPATRNPEWPGIYESKRDATKTCKCFFPTGKVVPVKLRAEWSATTAKKKRAIRKDAGKGEG